MPISPNTLRIAAWCCIAVLGYLSVVPGYLEVRTGAPDEVEHLAAYFVAAALFGLSYPRRRISILFALVIVAGALEALQGLSPGRSVRLLDFWASGAGAVLGMLTILLVARRKAP